MGAGVIHRLQYAFCCAVSGLLAGITLLPWGPLEVFELKTLDVRMWVRAFFDEPKPRFMVETLVLDDESLREAQRNGAQAESLSVALSKLVQERAPARGVLGIELPRWHPVATPYFQEVIQAAIRPDTPPHPSSLVVGLHSDDQEELTGYGLAGFEMRPLASPGVGHELHVGLVDCEGDNDGVVRRLPLVLPRDGRLYPTFLLHLVAAHDGVRAEDATLVPGRAVELRRDDGRVVRRIPVDEEARVLVNYRERPPEARLSVRSAVDADGAVGTRVVILGTTARSVATSHNVPLGGRLADIEVTAEALQTILSGDTIVRVGRWTRFFLTWGILFAGSLGMVRLPSWRGVVLGFGIVVAYFLVEKALFIGANVWLPFMLPVTAFTWGTAVFPVYGFRWRAKRHMEEMRLLRRFDELVLMNIAGGLIVADRHGMVLRHNPRAADLLGLPGESLHGRHVRELFAVSPAMLELLGQVMHGSHESRRDAGTLSHSTRVVVPSRAEGNERVFDLEVALLDPELLRSTRQSDLPCYVLTFDDVTEQVVRAQEEARRARLAAVGEIAAKLGHEIRNSLGGLRLYVENMRHDLRGGVMTEIIPKMLREIDFLHRKMDELRQFGADPKLEQSPTDLKELLDEALTFAHQRLGQKHIRVVLECERPLPPLRADRRQLREAFQNLINNAIDAAPEGGRVAIQVERAHCGNGNQSGVYRVHIEDNGPGIAPENQEQVFSLFFTTKPDSGTGLGLPIAKKIVESHGGRLSFSCGPRGGTRFTVSLPAGEPVEETA